MASRHILICLLLLALMVLGIVLIVFYPKEHLDVGLGIQAFILVAWISYKASPFYLHTPRSLPKNRLYRIHRRHKENGKFIFEIKEIGADGFSHSLRRLIYEENILDSYFTVNNKGEIEISPT
jgi:hypothetical protein